jgi:SanA protein
VQNLEATGTLFIRRPGFTFITDRIPVQRNVNRLFSSFFQGLQSMVNWLWRKRKILLLILFPVFVACCIFIWWSNATVEKEAGPYLYTDLNNIPAHKAGLVLGTSRFLTTGAPNPYFTYRIQAAKSLYFSGKIRYLLLSGDNRFFSYNEPREMRRELIRMGIPDSVIVLDFAGFRTFDSVIRGSKVFRLKKFIIVSQEFHNLRAVYIARHFGIEAIGFNAQDPPEDFTLKVRLREYLARAKMMLDLYVFHQQPYFLGSEQLPAGAYE